MTIQSFDLKWMLIHCQPLVKLSVTLTNSVSVSYREKEICILHPPGTRSTVATIELINPQAKVKNTDTNIFNIFYSISECLDTPKIMQVILPEDITARCTNLKNTPIGQILWDNDSISFDICSNNVVSVYYGKKKMLSLSRTYYKLNIIEQVNDSISLEYMSKGVVQISGFNEFNNEENTFTVDLNQATT